MEQLLVGNHHDRIVSPSWMAPNSIIGHSLSVDCRGLRVEALEFLPFEAPIPVELVFQEAIVAERSHTHADDQSRGSTYDFRDDHL